MEGRVFGGQRQGQQQPRDELRRDRAVGFGRAAAQRAADFHRQVSAVVLHPHAQLPERPDHHLHRAVQQRFFALDSDGRAAERGDGGEKAGRQPRFADFQHPTAGVQPAADQKRMFVGVRYFGAQRFDAAQGRTGVVAVFDVVQHGPLLREQRCRQGALGIALRAGGRQRASDAPRRQGDLHHSRPPRFFISWVSWWLRLSSKFCPK